MKKLFRRLSQLTKSILLQQIFPGFYADYSNRKIENIIRENEENSVDSIGVTEEKIKILKESLSKQNDRRKIIEDKAKSVLSTISICVAAITFTLNNKEMLFNLNISIFILFISILFLLNATIRAIQGINIRKTYVLEPKIEIESDGRVMSLDSRTPEEEFEILVKSKFLNDLILSKISNCVFASYILVRNGIVSFGLFFVVEIYRRVFC
ncbi:hypothetical protein [Siphonobacter aquaeclarae]|uniref:Uncharacterized protein n=1 Tax=Siphonobacter aquaeclarae TaxID=563176 RepID=A0A1G9K4F5_9BACT|nr:hypothetical protein [Siphonobacter aquaeclarae]SDL44651.1 hypothetical protein SAMN04488090_0876 [Siphonobacter aquaeclarae]